MAAPVSAPNAEVDERIAWVPRGLLIAGMWRESRDRSTMAVVDPSTGEHLATVADGDVADARAAMDAAAQAQRSWALVAPRDRGEILRRAFELMLERRSDLAQLITLEMGKPLAESESEVAYAAEFFRWFSEEAVRQRGMWMNAPDGQSRLMTMRQPVGPCLLVLPWNVPLAMGTRKVGPAIAAGCTVVIKPAEQTPLSTNALAAILIEAGLPPGIVNVLPTARPTETVAAIMADPRLRKLSFTGSTAVGRKLMERAAGGLIRLSMELGGNAPFIVFGDADIEHAASEAMKAKLRNNAEACTAANRFYVHESVIDRFCRCLTELFSRQVLGPGSSPGVTIGPLIDQAAVDKVDRLVDSALGEGARLAYRGRLPESRGCFYPATVLSDVCFEARIVAEEIFGPVAPIMRFTAEDEVVAQANASPHGLSSYLFTHDLNRALRVAEGIQAGMVGINKGVVSNPAAPFGGIKASGFGREGGREGIEEYLDTKYVAFDVESDAKL